MSIDIYTYAGTVGGGRPAHRLVTNSAASPRLDRTALSLGPMFEDSNEREYWHSRTPAERLRNAETFRRINYGSRAAEGLERVLGVVPMER